MIEPERRALCVGVSEFSTSPASESSESSESSDGEGELDGRYPLSYAADRVAELRAALELFGYVCADPGPDGSADAIGRRVRDVVTGAGPDDAVVVHVLSHGEVGERTGALYVVGADGRHSPASKVNGWLEEVEDFSRPRTLFLLDLCQSGVAARMPSGLAAGDSPRRAWAIAACGPQQQAFNGRFTQAVAAVLRAIATGMNPVYPGWEYVPLGTLAARIKRELRRLTGAALPQDAVATLVDLTEFDERLPFFRNPGYVSDPVGRVRAGVEDAVSGFLDDLDIALDPAHYLERASGHGPLAGQVHQGCFIGREEELAELSAWMDGRGSGALRVVTGSPGVGKSALLGLLVCAAHPLLRPATERLWFAAAHTPSVHARLAVVHARKRGQAEIMASMARQLGLDEAAGGDLAGALRAGAHHAVGDAVIVVDALDEATDPPAVMAELLRLAAGPGCRLLVGMRRHAVFEPLLTAAEHTGGLIDLDLVPRERVRDELRRYVDALLACTDPYGRAEFASVRRAFALAVAETLAALPSGGERWGEFLVAALFAHHLVTREEPIRTTVAAAELGSRVPVRLPFALELDLAARGDGRGLLRPVLTALAYARGAGMPLPVIEAIVPVFATVPPEDVRDVLERVLFYVRLSPDSEGNTLYRLFHQGLADHLTDHLTDHGGDRPAGADRTTARESAILDRLVGRGEVAWDAVDPYVARYAIQHAVAAGRADELLEDPEFLVHADPVTVLPELGRARSERARLHAAVYRASARRSAVAGPRSRRQILAVDAARYGAGDLAARLSRELTWRPVWATGGQVSSTLRATLPGGGAEHVVACTVMDGRPVVVVGSYDGEIRMWDPATGEPAGELRVEDRITALTCEVLGDRTLVVTGAADGTVHVRELPTGARVTGPLAGHADEVGVVTCTRLCGVVVAVSGSEDGTVRVWDIVTGRQLAGPLPGGDGPVLSAVGADVGGGSLIAAAVENGGSRMWELAPDLSVAEPTSRVLTTDVAAVSGAVLDDRAVFAVVREDGALVVADSVTGEVIAAAATDHGSPVTALGCAGIGGRPVAITGALDGSVRVWDITTGERIGEPFMGQGDMVHSVDGARVADRDVVVAVDARGTTRIWELTTAPLPGDPAAGHRAKVGAVTCTRLGDRPVIVTASLDGSLRVWDRAPGVAAGRPAIDAGFSGRALACTRLDGRDVAVTGSASGVRLWDLGTGEQLGDPFISIGDQAVSALTCTRIGGREMVITATVNGGLQVWDLTTRSLYRNSPKEYATARVASAVTAMAVCDRIGTRAVLVTGSSDGSLQIWDLETGWPLGGPGTDDLRHFTGIDAIACARFDGGKLMAITGAFDGLVRVWDLMTGEQDGEPLAGHQGAVEALTCVELDGRVVVVTGSADATVRIWDLATRQPLETIALPDAVHALAVSSRGELIAGMGWEIVTLSQEER